MLVSTSGDCDFQVLRILSQVESGLNPLPIILAETISGLDNFAASNRFTESLMLLEIKKRSIIPLLPLFQSLLAILSSFFLDMASGEIEDVGSP